MALTVEVVWFDDFEPAFARLDSMLLHYDLRIQRAEKTLRALGYRSLLRC